MRVEEVNEPLMQKVCYGEKRIGELAKRQGNGESPAVVNAEN